MTQVPTMMVQTKPHKFYAYRSTVIFFAPLGAFLGVSFSIGPCFLLLYPTISVLGDFIHYKLLKLKESDRVDPARLFYDEGITPQQLDEYVSTMSKVRLYAYGASWVAFIIGWFFDNSYVAFIATYCTINFVATMWAKYFSKIHQLLNFKDLQQDSGWKPFVDDPGRYAGMRAHNAAGDYTVCNRRD